MAKKVLVIGYGNPLRGDDGVGYKAAERMRRLPVNVIACHQLAPELAEPISGSDLVIFIDACCDNSSGKVVSRPLVPDDAPRNGFSHRVSPSALLAGAEQLYGRHPEAVLFTVSGEFFGFGETFSPAVETAFPVLLERVQQACGLSPADVTTGHAGPSDMQLSTRIIS